MSHAIPRQKNRGLAPPTPMDFALILLAILLAALVIWLVLQNSNSQKKGDALEKQLTDLRRDLQTIGTAQAQSTGQMQTIGPERLPSGWKA